MKSNVKKNILAVVLICIAITLVAVGKAAVLESRKMETRDYSTEKFIDEFVESISNGDRKLNSGGNVLFGSEDIAREYARILYKENVEYCDEWSASFDIWVKHYEKYGVWFAMFHDVEEQVLDGPPWIIFQDSDGKVIWYGN